MQDKDELSFNPDSIPFDPETERLFKRMNEHCNGFPKGVILFTPRHHGRGIFNLISAIDGLIHLNLEQRCIEPIKITSGEVLNHGYLDLEPPIEFTYPLIGGIPANELSVISAKRRESQDKFNDRFLLRPFEFHPKMNLGYYAQGKKKAQYKTEGRFTSRAEVNKTKDQQPSKLLEGLVGKIK